MSEGDISRAARTIYPSPVDVTAPAGFVAQELHDPFEALVGPLFERSETDGSFVYAFIADERHMHEDGTVHEGMMMTFADAFLGSGAHRGSGGKSCVTMSLQASFLASVRQGDLIECRTKVEKKTRSVMFVSASFSVKDEQVMTATSLWKVLGER